jgi:Fic family protein
METIHERLKINHLSKEYRIFTYIIVYILLDFSYFITILVFIMAQKIHTMFVDLDMKLIAELSKADRFDATWASTATRESDSLSQLRAITRIRDIASSARMDGAAMTDDETNVWVQKWDGGQPEERDKQMMAGCLEAYDRIAQTAGDIPVTEKHISDLHQLIMQYCGENGGQPGKYKQNDNSVESALPDWNRQLSFRTAAPGRQTENGMNGLLAWYASDRDTLPLLKIAVFIYDYLCIHPFQEGNGRMSRLLVNWLLLKQGFTWISYESFGQELEYRKDEYMRLLIQTQHNRPGEDVTEWVRFFLDCLVKVQDRLLRKVESLRKEAVLSDREKRIRFHIEHHPGCTSGSIARKLDIPLPTVKKTLRDLVQKEKVTRQGSARATGYMIV